MDKELPTTTTTKPSQAVRVSIIFLIGTAVVAVVLGLAAMIGRLVQR